MCILLLAAAYVVNLANPANPANPKKKRGRKPDRTHIIVHHPKRINKSQLVGRCVRKQFHMTDGQYKWYTGRIIRGTKEKSRVRWEDGSTTTLWLGEELKNGSVTLVRAF
jgi:hypothetical protein